MPGTRRKWSRFKVGLIDGGGLIVPNSITPDPATDFTVAPVVNAAAPEEMEEWTVTERAWNALSWSTAITPIYSGSAWEWNRYTEPGISPKPTWTKVIEIYKAWLKSTFLPTIIDTYASRYIAQIYHSKAAADRNKEWQARLSMAAAELAPKDAERVRMIGVCHALEARVKAATTLAELEAIDWFSPSVWLPPPEDEE